MCDIFEGKIIGHWTALEGFSAWIDEMHSATESADFVISLEYSFTH